MSKINSVYEIIDEDKFSIENRKKLANKIDFVQKNADTYINQYFQDVILDLDQFNLYICI